MLTPSDPPGLVSQGDTLMGIRPTNTVVQWPSHFYQCGIPLIIVKFSSVPHWAGRNCQI